MSNDKKSEWEELGLGLETCGITEGEAGLTDQQLGHFAGEDARSARLRLIRPSPPFLSSFTLPSASAHRPPGPGPAPEPAVLTVSSAGR